MGFIRRRKSIKILPGVRVNLNSKSTSVSIGGKYGRTTISSTGKRTHSTHIPGTNLTYVTTSTSSKKSSSSSYSAPVKKRSAGLYKFCGVLINIIGFIAILMGLISISVGGGVLMGIGVFCLIPGFIWLRIAKKIKKENNMVNTSDEVSEAE